MSLFLGNNVDHLDVLTSRTASGIMLSNDRPEVSKSCLVLLRIESSLDLDRFWLCAAFR